MDVLTSGFIFSPFNCHVLSDSPQTIVFSIEHSLEVVSHKSHWLLGTLLRQYMGTCSRYSLMPSKSPTNLVASNNNNKLLSLTVSMGQELEISLVGQVLVWDLSDGCRWLGLKSESSLIHIVWHLGWEDSNHWCRYTSLILELYNTQCKCRVWHF